MLSARWATGIGFDKGLGTVTGADEWGMDALAQQTCRLEGSGELKDVYASFEVMRAEPAAANL
jgi:hypothetical protein